MAKRGKTAKWSAEKVLRDLRTLHESGLPLNWTAISQSHSTLYQNAQRFCGSYADALRSIGVDPSEIRLRKWTPESVKNELRRIASEETFPTRRALWLKYPRCYEAAIRFFGNHDAAFAAAGAVRDPVERQFKRSNKSAENRAREWDRPSVILELRKLIGLGTKMSYDSLRKTHLAVLRAAERYFQSYSEALRSARISEDGGKS